MGAWSSDEEHRADKQQADPGALEVEGEGHSIVLEVSVHPDDMGKIIGKRGRVAQAIRTVVRAAAAREGMDVHVDIVD